MNLVFLDIDGVLTRLYDDNGYKDMSSYLNYMPSTYKPCILLLQRVKNLCLRTDSKIVISSNWRRFPIDGSWRHNGLEYHNPLLYVKDYFKNLIIGELPSIRHVTKCQALRLYEQLNGKLQCRYVILDDDPSEGFDMSEYACHYVLTDYKHGFTEDDMKEAERILTNDIL